MNRRDIRWIAGIWSALLILAATVAAFFRDADPATNDTLGAFVLATAVGALATGLYVYVRRRTRDPRDVRRVAGIWGLMAGAGVVLTLVTGHAYGSGLVVGVIGYSLTETYLWSRWRRRPCPDCGAHMPSDAYTCPRCGSLSTPWIRHDGVWWVRGPNDTWHWLDERAGTFRLSTDEAPTSPPFSRATRAA